MTNNKTASTNPTIDKHKPTLVSFSLCPYVQRSVISLKIKKVDFDLISIDLAQPPTWFNKISPTGKVPLLLLEDEVLFESAVINEFVDASFGEQRLQQNTLWQHAKERAWISIVDELIVDQYNMLLATDQNTFETEKRKIFSKLETIATETGEQYFSNNSFGLMDAAIAPFFTRLKLTSDVYQELEVFSHECNNNILNWSENLTNLAAVKNSVIENFDEEFFLYFDKLESVAFKKKAA